MTLLSMVQAASRRIGQAPPTVVIAATDETTLRLLEIAQDEGRELARFSDWRALRTEKTFTTVATETQSGSPIPTDLDAFIEDTFWNRSARRRLIGPVSPQKWQQWKAQSTFPVTDAFTLRGALWLMQPVPAAGQTIAYEYRSKNWCQSSGGTGQSAWAVDTDTGILDERLMTLGIVWRYKQARGLDWQTDYDKYMFQLQTALDKDKPRKTISFTGDGGECYGVNVPDGSWSI